MIIKECKKHGPLNEDQVIYEINEGYRCSRCKLCKREKDQRYKLKNRKVLSKKTSVWKKENRDKVNAWNRQDRIRYPEKYAEWKRKYHEKHGYEINTKEICRVYDIDRKTYDEMFERQNNKCAICKNEETCAGRKPGTVKRLAIDHCHATGKVRGLLCDACNKLLGHAKDSVETLELAIGYLIQFIEE